VKYIKKTVARTLKADLERSRFLGRWAAWAKGPDGGQRQGQEREPKPIEAAFLIRWLRENAVVEQILRPDEHPEVIRQGIQILCFLAHHDQLDPSALANLWKASLGYA
jgi:hypothetical protein